MKITVTDEKTTKEYNFREGTLASEAVTALGFDFPMPCGGRGSCGKCRCTINGSDALACKTPLFADSVIKIPSPRSHVLTAEKNVSGADGVAVDIGTTTIAAALFKEGRPVKTTGRRNPQCAYGADVISRIGSPDAAELTAAVRRAVSEIRSELGSDKPTVITGNTAMLALYCGLSVKEMGSYPFEPPSRFDCEFDNAYLPPCISAFVGADALCSLLWSGAAAKSERGLVIDLGTNGEILLVDGNEILSASTAAGPALEGAGIKYGMAAADGAICAVTEQGFSTVGNAEPRGICGSGITDAVALMLKRGVLDGFGTLGSDFEIYNSKIFITRQDVRAFQLCKAAISAAVKYLLGEAGLGIGDIDAVYLSGALGQSINVDNAVYTGLLPAFPPEKFIAVGNGALLGAAMLSAEENRAEARRLAACARSINLADKADFAELYISEMNFNI